MRGWITKTGLGVAIAAGLAASGQAQAAARTVAQSTPLPRTYPQLATFFAEWRTFVRPTVRDGVAEYGPATSARWRAGLAAMRARLAAIDKRSWPTGARNDARLIAAEIDGLDFDLRVLEPWARDPSFYANVFADWSDVPAHEGPSAEPNIDLYAFAYPLNAADERRLTMLLAAVPANLAAAKINLRDSNARDLWVYGDRAFKEQSATLASLRAGTLAMRTLDGPRAASLKGAGPELLRAALAAQTATDDFARWVAAQAPRKTGPSGVGKAEYNWHARHVDLNPYDWDQQVTLLRRELDRSIASLRLEEVRNHAVPPIRPIEDPAAYKAMVAQKEARFSDFMDATGLSTGEPWLRAAIANQGVDYAAPADRNFFSNVTALDPLPLIAHFTHWMDLARMREAPPAGAVRRVPPLFNIYANRSEGFATAFEEVTMQAGLYDDVPHGRELVWIMLANRAARGLASLYVQANMMDLAQAGKFHASWTPRGWSDPNSRLVGFEQLLYARQPGYGPSYIVGKLQLDRMIADASHADDLAGRPFVLKDFTRQLMASGIMPVALAEDELLGPGSAAAGCCGAATGAARSAGMAMHPAE